jgi:uncharacterized membrane protein HdeD (DUF308 family)
MNLPLCVLSRYWWAFIIRGIVAILFGLAAWFWPGLTLTALIIVFGAYALVDDIFAVVAGIASHGENRRWWAEVLVGIVSIAAAIITWVWPGLTALVLLYFIASWAVITGVLEIWAAVELRRSIQNEWLLGLGGLASLIFGILLFIFPGAGALGILWLIGLYAILFGILLIGLGWRMHSLHGRGDERLGFPGHGAMPPA